MRANKVIGCWVETLIALLLAAGVLLVAGCADSRQPTPDGQSHWLRSCDQKKDCGDLDCVCGVCTSACKNESEDACNSLGKKAVCHSADALSDTAGCDRKPASMSICVAECDHDADCKGVGQGLACKEGLCSAMALARVDDDRQAATVEAGEPSEQDASTDAAVDASAGDASDMAPVANEPHDADDPVREVSQEPNPHIECDGVDSDDWPEKLEWFEIPEYAEPLAAANGGVYGARTRSDDVKDRIWRFDEPEGPSKGILDWSDYVQFLAIDGDELFVVSGDSGLGISKVALADGSSLNLTSPSFSNIYSFVVASDAIYWITDGDSSPRTGYIMRTDREPGATAMLASSSGQPLSLRVLGDTIYYAMLEGPFGEPPRLQTQMYGLAKDGSGTAQPFGPPEQINSLICDGTGLFVALVGRDDLGNPRADRGIASVNIDDGALTLLFPDPDVIDGSLVADADSLYWTSGIYSSGLNLWRPNKDGSGKAMKLTPDWPSGGPERLVLTDSSVYWSIHCDDTAKSYLMRIPK